MTSRETRYKTRIETETTIADCDAMAESSSNSATPPPSSTRSTAPSGPIP